MNKDLIPFFDRLAKVYSDIGEEYDRLAGHYRSFSCEGCQDNCCTTVFSHYTLIEHLYFLEGFRRLQEKERADMTARAKGYAETLALHSGPAEELDLMCPVNVDGLCGVYKNRPLICRIHGLPSLLRSPRGVQQWKGCLRFQEMHGENIDQEMDRTGYYSAIASIEADLRKDISFFHKYKKTIADMVLDLEREGMNIVKSVLRPEESGE